MDDQESYFSHVESLPPKEDDEEEEYLYDEDGNPMENPEVISPLRVSHMQFKDKAIMEPLPRIDHALVPYLEVNKAPFLLPSHGSGVL